MSKEEIYKNEYMQIPCTMLTDENLNKLEEHCKNTIRFERGIEHSVVLELLYKYKEIEKEKQEVLDLIFQYAQIDESHHKAWVIDQIVRILLDSKYKEWVREYKKGGYSWDIGIAP